MRKEPHDPQPSRRISALGRHLPRSRNTLAQGWELHISTDEHGDIGVTQSHGLADADYMARDYLATTYDLTDAEAAALVVEF